MHYLESEGTVDNQPWASAFESAVTDRFAELQGKLAELQRKLAEDFERTVAGHERQLKSKVRELQKELSDLREQPQPHSQSENEEAAVETRLTEDPAPRQSEVTPQVEANAERSSSASAGWRASLVSTGVWDESGAEEDDCQRHHFSQVKGTSFLDSDDEHIKLRKSSFFDSDEENIKLRKSCSFGFADSEYGSGSSRKSRSSMYSRHNSLHSTTGLQSCLRKSTASSGRASKVVKIQSIVRTTDGMNSEAITGMDSLSTDDMFDRPKPPHKMSTVSGVSMGATPSERSAKESGMEMGPIPIRLSRDFGCVVRAFFKDPGKQHGRILRQHTNTFSEHEASQEAASRFVIAPNSRFRLMFEMLSICALSYDAVMTPWILAWNPKDFFYTVASLVILVFWACDMVLNFFTGYFEQGEVVMQHRVIAMKYLKTWFAADFTVNAIDCASLVFEIHASDTNNSSMSAGTLLMRAMRLIKVNKLLRIMVFLRRSAEKTAGQLSGKLQFVGLGTKLVATLLWLNHVISCMWYYIGDSGFTDTGYTWLDMEPKIGDGARSYRDAGPLYQYCTSLHWAMTQMTPGSMSVVPQNSIERLFNVVCLFVGLFVGALLVSQLSARMVKVQLANQEQNDRMINLQTYMRENNIGWRLRARVQQQILERLDVKKRLTAKEVPMLGFLSTSLRKELCCASFAHQVMTHTLFHAWGSIDRKLVESICLNVVELVVLSQDDDLFTPLSVADKVYHILRGTLRYNAEEDHYGSESMTSHHETKKNLAAATGYVADREIVSAGMWISEAALWMEWSYSGTLTSMTECELLAMHVPSLMGLLKKHQKVRALNHYYCTAFSKLLLAEPMGLHDIYTNSEHLLMGMPMEWRLEVMMPLVERLFQNGNSINDFMGWHRGHVAPVEAVSNALNEGKAVLSLHNTRATVFSLVVHLSITRRSQKQQLFCLAEGSDGILVAQGCLPSTRLEHGENPYEAAVRVLRQSLPCFQECVIIDGVETELENAHAEIFDSATTQHHHVNAKRMTSTVSAYLQSEDYVVTPPPRLVSGRMTLAQFDHSKQAIRKSMMASKRVSTASRMSGVMKIKSLSSMSSPTEDITDIFDSCECFLVRDMDGVENLYGWINEFDIESIRSSQGVEQLRWWLTSNEGRFGEASSKQLGFSL